MKECIKGQNVIFVLLYDETVHITKQCLLTVQVLNDGVINGAFLAGYCAENM
jgi:hypothetical protein